MSSNHCLKGPVIIDHTSRALRASSLLPTLMVGSSSFHASSTMMTMLTPASAVTPRAFNRLALMRALQRYTSDVAYSTYANEPGAWLAALLISLILSVDVAAFLSCTSSAMQIRLNSTRDVTTAYYTKYGVWYNTYEYGVFGQKGVFIRFSPHTVIRFETSDVITW